MIDVVGLTARGWTDLPGSIRAIVSAADLVIGSPRQLALVRIGPEQRAAELPAPLRERLPDLLREGDRVVLLASGDPLLSGIGSTLVSLGLAPTIHPAVSSVALARARMGWPAESCETVSAVGRDLDRLRRLLAPGARLIVLSADEQTPAAIADLLVDAGYGDSTLTVLGNLGAPEETMIRVRAADGISGDVASTVARLNLVCLECAAEAGAPLLGWVAGLPDGVYENDGQLTKRDVRAAVLARLAPRPGELLWDLGAGAGSVAIEWCRADRRCRAIAVEHEALRAERIGRNAGRLGVPGLEVVRDEVEDAIVALPTPDAIFVGGGGSATLLDACWEQLAPDGRLVAAAVTLESEQLLVEGHSRLGGELVRVSVDTVTPLGRYQSWSPARPVVIWSVRR